jgi:hypothetical protein
MSEQAEAEPHDSSAIFERWAIDFVHDLHKSTCAGEMPPAKSLGDEEWSNMALGLRFRNFLKVFYDHWNEDVAPDDPLPPFEELKSSVWRKAFERGLIEDDRGDGSSVYEMTPDLEEETTHSKDQFNLKREVEK